MEYEYSRRTSMAIARNPLINPEALLAQTAYDLAAFIYQLSKEQLMQIFKTAEDQYTAPMASWIWFIPYAIYPFRKRSGDFTEAENLIKERDLTELKAFEAIIFMFDKENATWNEESANTILIRQLLKSMDRYDPAIQMTPQKLKELYSLLSICMSQRIALSKQLQAAENKLASIQEKNQPSKELIEKMINDFKAGMNTIKLAKTTVDKNQALTIIKTQIEEQQKKLKRMVDEEGVLQLEIEALLNQIVELNPIFKIPRLLLEKNNVYAEAVRVGKLAADAAVREYLARIADQMQRKQDLENLTAAAPDLSERIEAAERAKAEIASKQALIASRIKIAQEVKEDCEHSSVVKDDGFKLTLADLVSRQLEKSSALPKPVPEKQVVVVKQTDLMRERQSILEESGFFKSRANVAPKAESSCSHQPRK